MLKEKALMVTLAMIFTASCSASENNLHTDIANSLSSNINTEGNIEFGDVANSLSNMAISNGVNNYLHGENAKDWMKRTEVQFYFRDNWKPVYSVETIQPLYETSLSTVFTQFRLANTSDIGTTSNLGFGYRKTNKSETNLYGVNVILRSWI